MDHVEGRFGGVAGVEIYWQAWLPEAEPLAVVVIAHGAGEHSGRYPHRTLRLYDGLYHEIFNEPEQATVLHDVTTWLDAHSNVRAREGGT
jgi:alpha-beta hydrolase superfamily lysophospholipase